MGYIYVITNKINGKQYVGKTLRTIEERFKQHLRDSDKITLEQRPLYKAIQKYGKENFEVSLLEECSFKELNIKEIYWIGKLDTYKNGYNATLGGDRKILYDYQELTDLYLKKNISIKALALELGCDEHTISKALKECHVKPKSTKEQLSKKVAQIDKKTNEILQIFPSCEAAEKVCGKRGGHISQVCKGTRKSAHGYKWQYV